MENVNVLVVEDHSIVRTGIKNTLKEFLSPTAAVTAVERFSQAVQALSAQSYQLVILDINVPGGDAPAMIQKLRDIQIGIKVLVFSGYDEQFYALPYLQAGANGYISKNVSDEEFVQAVKTVLNGDTYLSQEMQQQAINKLLHNKKEAYNGSSLDFLSSREMEVFQLLIKGYTTAQISALIHLQLSTVSTYKRRIFDKTGVTNIVELMNLVKK